MATPKGSPGVGGRPSVLEPREAEIVARITEGESISDLARDLGVSRDLLWGFAKRRGLSAGRTKPLRDNEAEVVSMRRDGASCEAIAERYGVNVASVRAFVARRGLSSTVGVLPQNEAAVLDARRRGETCAQIAGRYGVTKEAVGQFIKLRRISTVPDAASDRQPPTKYGTGIESVDPKEWGDIRKLLADKGLKQEEWIVTGARVNKWAEYDQLRVDIVPTLDLILPARTEGYTFPKPAARAISSEPKMVAFFGDQHAPLHDRGLHEAACQWLTEHQPDRLILVGDLMDYDAVSRHAADPENGASLQQCIDGGYALVRAYREAAPNAEITALDGNHEERLRAVILKQIASLYRLRPGVLPGEQEPQPLLSTRHLLRLDELHVEWIDPHGSYEHAQVKVSPELAARHGWIAKKGSGSSALATIDHLRHSCVIGHTHKQSVVHHTAHDIDGEPHTLLGAETGTMSQVRGGHGYAVAPDWQQGFATATVWPDGRFKLDLATYVDGTLLWRDWRCTP